MAYSRWSTVLSVDLQEATGQTSQVDALVAWYQLSAEERERHTANQGGAQSNWYIFWHTESDDSQGRQGQLLAVWCAGHKELPLMDYGELRRIADQDDWRLIPGFKDDDHPLDMANLKRCVIDWLADVEDSHPDSSQMTRLELAQRWHRKALNPAEQEDNPTVNRMVIAANAARLEEISRRAQAAGDEDYPAIAQLAAEAASATLQAAPMPDPTEPSRDTPG